MNDEAVERAARQIITELSKTRHASLVGEQSFGEQVMSRVKELLADPTSRRYETPT